MSFIKVNCVQVFLCLLFIGATSHQLPAYLQNPKCCGDSEYLKSEGTGYTCANYTEGRYMIVAREVNFLSKNLTGGCYDITQEGIVLFKKEENSFTNLHSSIIGGYFTKCCPRHFVYNHLKRACVENLAANESFIYGQLVQIGLPECSLIEDEFSLFLEDFLRHATWDTRRNCIDLTESNIYVKRVCHEDYTLCKKKRCLRKCCPDGHTFVGGAKCQKTPTIGVNLNFSDRIEAPEDNEFALIHGYNHCRLYIMNLTRYIFHIDTAGNFVLYNNITGSTLPYPPDDMMYCMEHVSRKSGNNGYKFFSCLPEVKEEIKYLVTRWIKVVSIVCLFLTLLVYTFLSELRNLFGKILMSYCICLLSTMICLSYFQFENKTTDYTCYNMGFMTIFSVLAGIFWLNVICYDVWSTLGSSRTKITIRQKNDEFKRFWLYSTYGWVSPLALSFLIYALNKSAWVPYSVKPIVGLGKCYLKIEAGNWAFYLYMLFPMTILEIINTVLFIKTVVYCFRVKAQIKKMNDTESESKKIFAMDTESMKLLLKLTVIMGVSYLFEVVSSTTDFSVNEVTKYIEVVWDSINCCQGVFIFWIFVCKERVFNLIKSKIAKKKTSRKISVSSTLTTQMTLNGTSKIYTINGDDKTSNGKRKISTMDGNENKIMKD